MKMLLLMYYWHYALLKQKIKSQVPPVKHLEQSTSKDSIPPDTAIIDFNTRVKPIFVNHCSPCHFTGGKMYERLPFDKDTTIINHEAGILRRIKGEENLIIKTFIDQNK